jgi:hypothetical protein
MTKDEQFETLWKCYPRRVAKGAARKAFDKAIKKTTLENMLKAITDYVAKKPEKIDFKHPATWLNGECWCDEWEPAQPKAPSRAANYGGADVYRAPEPMSEAERARRADMVARARMVVRGAIQ